MVSTVAMVLMVAVVVMVDVNPCVCCGLPAQVFFLQSEDYPGGLSDPADHSRLTENVARAFCVALLPHLKLLKEDGMAKLGLRVTLDSDQVGVRQRRRRGSRPGAAAAAILSFFFFFFAVAGGLPGREQRSAPPAAVPERPGQRPDPRHPRRSVPAERGSRGHGVDLLHFGNHLVAPPPTTTTTPPPPHLLFF